MNAKPETQNSTLKGAFTTLKWGSKLHNDCISRFKMIRADTFYNVIVGILNINSISSKCDEFN